jgi:DNA-binding response OmpR family regulator
MRLLLVEDDLSLRAAMREALTRLGYQVAGVGTAGDALNQLGADPPPEIILLDVGLPDQDGFEICEQIRRRSRIPIIMVSARIAVESRVKGLNAGADDYLAKPFKLAELVARIQSVARRSDWSSSQEEPSPQSRSVKRVGPLVVDPNARTVTVHGAPKSLTRKEFDVLNLLAGRPGEVFRREEIIGQVWRSGGEGGERTLEVHIASLRTKLGVRNLIETARGIGYRVTTG